jgi:RNA polymerase sigma factor
VATIDAVNSLLKKARQGDAVAREKLLATHRDFITKVVSWRCHRPVDAHCDEFSIGLMAFNEAITTYDPGRGAAFLSYARRVISTRLVDYYRREVRRSQDVPLTVEGPEGESALHPEVVSAAEELSQAEEERRERAAEILAFSEELAYYGLTLEDVERACPRHRAARAKLLAAAEVLAQDKALMERLRRTRQVPLKELALLTGLNRKILERGRRYILAVSVIRANPEYSYLENYVKPERGGTEGEPR